jgi:rhodanese-related sulfurtransferase
MKYADINFSDQGYRISFPIRFLGWFISVLILSGSQVLAAPGTALDQTRLQVLAESIQKGQAYIRSEELAGWIIQETNDYMLIDIRTVEDYTESHIQGAIHIPLLSLLQTDEIAALPDDRIIVLYANNSLQATQVATALQLAGKNAYALIGGYEYWVMRTLNPDVNADEDPRLEQLDDARRAAIAHALKNCETPLATPAIGYTPPLIPADEPAPPIPSTGGGVLLDGGC